MINALLAALFAFFTTLAAQTAPPEPASPGLTPIDLAATVPSWQRQPAESCQQYSGRVSKAWEDHWCGDGPCFNLQLATHQYWTKFEHGCCVNRVYSTAPNSVGWRCDWGNG